jgi:FMN phosphatase YigB (HAD superfamily)
VTDELRLDAVRVLVCDAYGTLVQRGPQPDPYRALWALRAREVSPHAFQQALREPRSFEEQGHTWGVPAADIARLGRDLEVALAAVRRFPEVPAALQSARSRGWRIVVCSNLATPYADPVRAAVGPWVDDWVWSFAYGAIKPEAALFRAVEAITGQPARTHLMVGDRVTEDVRGPHACGWQAVQIARPGQPGERHSPAWSDLKPLTVRPRLHPSPR